MKAALEKVGPELEFESIRTAFSANLFDEFQIVSQEETWKNWIEDKVVEQLFFFSYFLLLRSIRAVHSSSRWSHQQLYIYKCIFISIRL